MPSIWIYSDRIDDVVEHWVDDTDWDQQSWDEWDRAEALREHHLRSWYALYGSVAYQREWHNMLDGASDLLRVALQLASPTPKQRF